MTRIFLTTQEVADILKLNILTIYEYIRSGELQAIKLGRNYRIEEINLDKFISAKVVRSKGNKLIK